MIDKPVFGQPCNGCGLCCKEALCPLGESVFEQDDGPCPGLEYSAALESWRCGLVVSPELFAPFDSIRYGAARMSAAARLLTGAGVGCDAVDVDSGEREPSLSVAFDMGVRASTMSRDEVDLACLLWRVEAVLTPYGQRR